MGIETPSFESQDQKEPPSFNPEFYITDHSSDYADTGNPETLRALYKDIKRDGIDSIRYDWHWKNVEPKAGEYSEEHLARYSRAKELMAEAGLKEPTIILSNPPAWAVELYKTDKEKFYDEYKKYVGEVKKRLEETEGPKVSKVQILNELNTTLYTPVKVEDLPRLCEITREVFQDYNPDIKLMGTVIASNTVKFAGTPIEEYLPKLKKIKDSFDIIAVDYYPGLWHLPVGNAPSLKPGELFKYMAKEHTLLKQTFEELATWGKEYELGEMGLPSKKLWGGEKGQRYFYDAFFRAFKQTVLDLESRGLQPPSRVGLYQAIDEAPRNFLGRMLRKTPFPEFDLGMRTLSGERKSLLQGNPHLPEEERMKQPSQLSKIIKYIRAPLEKAGKE